MIRKIHLWVGISGFILFLLSGQYFKLALAGLQGLENTPRLLLRTSHIYLFLTSIINLVFGLHYVPPQKVRWYTIYNQALIMLAPLFIGYSFIFETITNSGIERNYTVIGMLLILAWLGNTAIGKIFSFFKFNKAHGAQ